MNDACLWIEQQPLELHYVLDVSFFSLQLPWFTEVCPLQESFQSQILRYQFCCQTQDRFIKRKVHHLLRFPSVRVEPKTLSPKPYFSLEHSIQGNLDCMCMLDQGYFGLFQDEFSLLKTKSIPFPLLLTLSFPSYLLFTTSSTPFSSLTCWFIGLTSPYNPLPSLLRSLQTQTYLYIGSVLHFKACPRPSNQGTVLSMTVTAFQGCLYLSLFKTANSLQSIPSLDNSNTCKITLIRRVKGFIIVDFSHCS